jgi:hypothetical protein
MNDFTTVFLFSESFRSYNGKLPLFAILIILGVLVIILGAVLFNPLKDLLFKSSRETYPTTTENILKYGLVTILVFMIFLIFIFIEFFVLAPAAKQRACASTEISYANQQYKIAEGAVQVLHIQPSSGHDRGDVVQIGETQFEVDAYTSSCGYTTTISHGGVLTQGTYARVFYDNNFTILRIDVKK